MTRLSLFALVVASACDRSSKAPEQPPPLPRPGSASAIASGAAAAPAIGCSLERWVVKRPMPKRLVAIGDLHGDLGGARAALLAAGAIDANDHWVGGELVVVQTGDVLDRGPDEQAILDLLAKLQGEAKAAGGELITLIGNHELMNAAGDFRYVPPNALHDFDDAPGLDTKAWQGAPAELRGRLAALGPGGLYAKRIAQHGVIAIVGDTIFSHAGVLGDWVTQIDAVNESSRCWLAGQDRDPEHTPSAMMFDNSPVWTRAVGDPDAANVDCKVPAAALASLKLARMVVGHTVQPHVNGICNNTVWRIDVGLAKVYGGPIEVLQLAPEVKVLTGTRL